MNFRLAVKAFIVKNGKVLLLMRRANDPHKPSTWDIPGGRLELGEDPYEGIKREVKEEIGIEVNIKFPMDIQHFTRDDGQLITMIIFICEPKKGEIVLSEEHVEYKWVDIANDNNFPDWIQKSVKSLLEFDPKQYIA